MSTTFQNDMAMVRTLENRMTSLGNRYFQLEKMLDTLGHSQTAPARIGDKMADVERQQDKINSDLNKILRKYKVYYNRTYFMVEHPDGGEQEYFYSEDEK